MKIAFLTPEFPHPKTGSSGGIGTSIFNLSKGLVNLGHKVIILVYGQKEDEIFQENGITFYRIKNIKVKGISAYLTQKKIQKLINDLYKNKQIDIVEAPDWTGFSAFLKPKCPLVIRLNGSDTYFCHLDNRPVKWKNKFQEKRALKNADGIISVSKFTGDLTNKLFKISKPFEVIPNSIDLYNFESSTHVNNNTILYFGTLIRKKGLLEVPLIFNEVYKNNKNAKLILAGKDASDVISGNSSTWQMMIPLFNNEAFQNVQFIGSLPYTEIKKQIQQATVCVFPTFAEALPVSWIEAMAMQKPVVASNIGWANEIITDEKDGLLEHPNRHEEFANKINSILTNEALQIEMGVEARKKIIQKFSKEVVAKQSVAFYQKFLK
ncbi:glycosyltransferase family 4 protein [Flavobacterium sp.]|uniref:glycosyltransferase family 4 protein n=1 Tax=Flavobacterium sp. TaxID=239 RepID=UPI002619EE55|nr:glycosyltransferase family 4 protein [Flavobacterium sp.]